MVDPFIWLLLLCITMFLGSFLAGCIPLSTKLSETKLRNLTALGVGLLIGTALVIIIPEGIETLYSSNAVSTTGNGTESMLQQHVTTASSTMDTHTTDTTPVWQEDSSLQKRQPHNHASEDEDEHKSTEHSTIGLAMIVGFAMMFVVDQVSSLHVHGSSSSTHHHHHHHEYSELSLMDGNGSSSTATSHGNGNGSPEQRSLSPTSKSITPTVGLIVHAAADGIALGASATHPELSMVVFLAIMLHKAPSAFALTTVLLAEGLSRVSVRRHLLIFHCQHQQELLVPTCYFMCFGLLLHPLISLIGLVYYWYFLVEPFYMLLCMLFKNYDHHHHLPMLRNCQDHKWVLFWEACSCRSYSMLHIPIDGYYTSNQDYGS